MIFIEKCYYCKHAEISILVIILNFDMISRKKKKLLHNLCKDIYKSFRVIQEEIVRLASRNNLFTVAFFPNIPGRIADTQKWQNNLLCTH